MDFDVQNGWTPAQKAERLAANLALPQFARVVNMCPVGNTVCMRLRADNRLKLIDVSDGQLKEAFSGQKKVRVFDPPSVIKTGLLNVTGIPSTPGSVVVLQLGEIDPEVSVPTSGKSISEIKSDLIEAFNLAYGGLGFTAAIGPSGAVEIPFVPCDRGIAGGTDDTGLAVTTGFDDVEPAFTMCDVDRDEVVDRDDIESIFSARGAIAAPSDPRDSDSNGRVTVNDARICVLQEDRPPLDPCDPVIFDATTEIAGPATLSISAADSSEYTFASTFGGLIVGCGTCIYTPPGEIVTTTDPCTEKVAFTWSFTPNPGMVNITQDPDPLKNLKVKVKGTALGAVILRVDITLTCEAGNKKCKATKNGTKTRTITVVP